MSQPHMSRRAVLVTGALGLVGAAVGVTSAQASPALLPGSIHDALRVRRWNDPTSWPSRRVPGSGDVAVVRQPIVVSGPVRVAGVRIEEGGSLIFDPGTSTVLESVGNIVVAGRLTMRPSQRSVVHRLTLTGADEARFVGGGQEVLETDVGLWFVEGGVLDARGTPVAAWNRSGTDSSWRPRDELLAAPLAVGDYEGFHPHRYGTASDTVRAPGGTTVQGEVFNLSRNVIIGGTLAGRSHIAFMHAGRQTIKHVRIEHVGPRQAVSAPAGYTTFVPGRYGLHFHMGGEMTRGTLIEGVAVVDCGTRAFVPHASHGITFRDCVAYNTAEEAFWWDPEPTTRDNGINSSDDVTFERCAAFGVGGHVGQLRDNTMAAFRLGTGRRNACRDSAAVGVTGTGVQSSGFLWPENGGREGGEWTFTGCTSHNNRALGIFFWQNDPHYNQHHLIEDFTLYRNGLDGVVQGAYLSNVSYVQGRLFENGVRGISQWRSLVGWDNRIENVVIDGGGVSEFAFLIGEHRTAKDVPTVMRNVDLRGGLIAPVGVQEGHIAGYYDFLATTVDGTRDLEPADFAVGRMAEGSRVRVQRADGTAYAVTATGAVPIPAFA